ncbi:MAG: hypothetical protein EAZ08_01760 [Cytophagales bacterium]|nr:MAG: hypothetical protein EAZ08_01760 [Cytophagales bacterium]
MFSKNRFFYGLQILEENPNDIWVVSFNALLRYDLHKGETLCYQNETTNPNSISSSNINTLYKDSKGRYWIGTNEGLNLMQKEGLFKRITTKNGLPNDAIKGILEDDHGYLWLSTNKGLSKFNPDENTFQNFDIVDGLQSDEFIRKAAFKDKNGYLYFGGVKGLNIFHPDSIKNNTYKPPVHIIGLKIFNKPVKIGDYDSLLRSEISKTKEITLSYQQSVLTLDFVGINFTHSEKNQYAYILEGFEKDWNYVGNQRNATYTNLDAGTYTFRVKASNNDKLWNEEGATLKITILPPWWETWWFRTMAITLFLSSGIIFYLIRINAVKRQNQILEQKVVNRTEEIEKKSKELEFANYEVKVKNEALQASEEELRHNMEELETNQELLKDQKQTIEIAFTKLNIQNTKVNDSIRYAQRIQNAILPHQDILATAFAEHFVIFKPKDVVSGDFYWYIEVENKKFLAIVDCTGHGVPGAFMSMIGNTLLYEIINAKRIFESNLILGELHLGILNSLNKKDAKIQDGMDIALCCIEKQMDNKVKVQFSGAKRPLYYFSNNQLTEIQADRKSIGQALSSQTVYTSNTIELQVGDTLYMSTDGWIDSINPERVRFGSQKFKDMLLGGTFLPLAAQGEMFGKILEEYEQGTEQRDDVLLVGVRV